MNHLLEIVRSRLAPGILIFSLDNRLLYSNREALAMLPGIPWSDPAVSVESGIPPEILHLCERVKKASVREGLSGTSGADTDCSLLLGGEADSFSLRAFLVGSRCDSRTPNCIMVLVETVVEKHAPDFNRTREEFNLSGRELEVTREIYSGLSNRAIAQKLFISEYTVKDHLKNIMGKMKVGSRNELIASLKF